MNPIRQKWEERYNEETQPWDSGITPPEVVDFWQSSRRTQLPHQNLALDLGCGTGTNVAYLAALGLTAIGIELSGNGLSIAQSRLPQIPKEHQSRIALIQASVAAIPFQNLNCCYILDIGCLHNLPHKERPHYAAGVVSNLSPGGFYHLYGFDKLESPDEQTEHGLGEDEVVTLLGDQMEAIYIEQANPAPNPCRWYLFRRRVSE
ncbi:MAG: class I SAM-dependent methyltransferase [Chloroflexota bacterium]